VKKGFLFLLKERVLRKEQRSADDGHRWKKKKKKEMVAWEGIVAPSDFLRVEKRTKTHRGGERRDGKRKKNTPGGYKAGR